MGKGDSLRWDNQGKDMFKGKTVVFALFKTKVRSASQTWGRTYSGCNLERDSRTIRSPSVLVLVSLRHREMQSFPVWPSTLAKRLDLALGGYGGVRADCRGPGTPRVRPWRPSRKRRYRPVARPSLRHHRFARRRLGLSPASLSSCRAALLSSASRPRPRRLPPAGRFRAMLAGSVTPDSRVGLQRVSACSFLPEAGHVWPRPLTRVGPRPPKKLRPM